MTHHYNTSIIERAARVLNSKQGDFLSTDVSGPYVTIPIQPASRVLGNVQSTASGTSTIFTSSASGDTYITAVSLALVKNVTCDIANGRVNVNCVIDGVTRDIIALPVLTLTAQESALTITFPHNGLRIDRSSIVQIGGVFTAGNMIRTATVAGYIEEVK